MEKLVEKFHGKFKKEDIKREWHNLQAVHKREKSREESSKVSGSGSCDAYFSTWEHFQYDPKEWCYLKKKVMNVFYNYERHKSNSHSTYPNNPSYLANQFIQEHNFQPAHFMNMVSNVSHT